MNGGKFTRARWSLALVLVLAAPLALAQGRTPAASSQGSSSSPGSTAAPGVPAEAVPANVCVPQSVTTTVAACPEAATRFGSRAQTAPPAAARLTPQNSGPNPNRQKATPTVQLDEATRRNQQSRQRRAHDLLVREVQLTATLARQTPRNDPHRPDVLMRLAENLQELGSSENGLGQEMEEQIFRARNAHNDREVAELQRQQRAHFTQRDTYRNQLIAAFRTLVTDHPTYSRMDEALFYLAFAYQDSRDMAHARETYLTLIQRFPQSRYIPNAYLSFAEFFFEQGAMEEARQFYQRVVDVGDRPENQVYGYALYKMAWVHYNLQAFDESLQTFYRVIDYARQHQDNPSVGPLLRSARQELVTVYGAVFGVSRPLRTGDALNTFRRYAADEDGAYAMLERLGELYQDNGQWPNSIAVYHQLMESRSTSDRFCAWQGAVTRAVVASRPRDQQMVEIRRLRDVYEQYRGANSTRPQEARNTCRDAAARIIFDVASHWHLEAIGRSAEGAQQTRGTRDQATMARAAELYDALVNEFPDLDSIEFPDYQRPDWPSRYRIAYYRADILRDQGNFAECGPAYDRVVEMNPTGEFTEDAAYKAVLCYNDLFSSQLAAQSRQRPARTATGQAQQAQSQTARQRQQAQDEIARLTRRDLNTQESGMARAFTRYICFAGNAIANGTQQQGSSAPPRVGNEGEDPRTTLLTIRYRRAYLYYAANQFEQASTLFREIAMSDGAVPDPENLREIAADLYLDALNVMGGRFSPARPACFDNMATDVTEFKRRFCTPQTRSSHEEFCGRMDTLECQILRRRAQALHDTRRYLEAGRAYVSIVREHPECQNSAEARVDEILYNAAIEFDAANMLGRAMRVRDVLVQRFLPRNSQWAQRALYRLAGNYHAIQVFSRAADYYEQYADYVAAHRQEAMAADPQAIAQAADALRQATIFRIGLGEDAHALENANKFARYFGNDNDRRRQAASVVFSIGQIYIDRAGRLARQTGGTPTEIATRRQQIRAAWQEVVRHYTNFVNRYARNGTVDQQIQGNVALGRGYWNLEDQNHARLYFQAAVGAWGEQPAAQGNAERPPAPGEARIREQLGEEAADAIERSRDAVAEARFYLAEIVYRRFSERRLPAYRGAGTRRAYDAWAQRTLVPFVQQQRRSLEQEATQAFQSVINMHVPNWEIAAAARLADMFYQFAQYIRTAPVPPDIQRNPDLLDAYNVYRDEQTQTFVNVAKTGFEGCITVSTRVHWFNEWSQLCERSLNQIDRRRYPLADEVRVEPNLVFSRATNSRPVYQVGGEGDDEATSSSGQQGGLGGTAETTDSRPGQGSATPPSNGQR